MSCESSALRRKYSRFVILRKASIKETLLVADMSAKFLHRFFPEYIFYVSEQSVSFSPLPKITSILVADKYVSIATGDFMKKVLSTTCVH